MGIIKFNLDSNGIRRNQQLEVLEGIVRAKLEKHFYSHKLINENQHGFVRFKSCVTNLLESKNMEYQANF
jgi:hypothetical protein